MTNEFHKIKVIKVDYPIRDATTLTLEIPTHLKSSFLYSPGQHLVLRFKISDKELRRCYSLNSSPYKKGSLQITVKRVKDGSVSNFIGDHIREGSELEVMAPQGRFFAELNQKAYKTYFLFAAGSGITPIFSILKSILLAEPLSYVNLFYGNKDHGTILFKEELEQLVSKYQKKLNVVHTLSSPNDWKTWKSWKGKRGRIDAQAVEWFITQYPPTAQHSEYFICGPGAMNAGIKNTLIDLGIPRERVHVEQFGGVTNTSVNKIEAVDNAELITELNGQVYNLKVQKGKTLLQTLKEAQAQPPYSCESGVCGTCIALVKNGKATMKSCMALEEAEITKGYILTCQAVPITGTLQIQFIKN